MPNTTSSTMPPSSSKTFARDRVYLITVLLLIVVIFVAFFECALILKLRSDRGVLQSVIAGATRAGIESKYGQPRFQSLPGRKLADAGWNGGEKDKSSEYGMSVYSTSVFEFIICEFDGQDRLIRAWIWKK